MKNKIRLFLFVNLLCALFMYSLVSAIGADLSVLEHEAAPGVTYNYTLKVLTDQPALEIGVFDWDIDESGNSVIFFDKEFDAKWLKIPKFIEKKNKKDNFINVPYSIRISADQNSEVLAKIMIKELSGPSDKPINISLQLGVPLYVWAKDKMKFGFKIADVFYEKNSQTLAVTGQNLGNVHIRPLIKMALSKVEGIWPFEKTKLIEESELTREWPILAFSKRMFVRKIDLPKGTYQIKLQTVYGQTYQKNFSDEETKKFSVK